MNDKKPLTRAEIVRQRRKQEEARQLATPSVPVQKRIPTPPSVTTRNVTVDAATVRAKPAPKAARQYQAVASAPMTQTAPLAPLARLRAPSLPRIRVGWRLASFILTLVFGAAVYYAFTLPMFRVGAATLTGNQFMTAAEVDQAMGLSGQPIFMVIPANAETSLRLTFHEIKSAHVTVQLPNQILVQIIERVPVMRWEQGGAFTWVDEEGVAFRPRGEVGGLVVINASAPPPPGPRSASDAYAPAPFVDAQIVAAARLLAPYVPQGSGLLYDSKYGIGWVDTRGWTVWFGASPAQMDLKLRVYVVLVDSLAQRGITPVMINVAFPDAPYYRLGQ